MKYSVLIPTKQGMPYLGFAVRSVLEATFDELELIVSVEKEESEAVSFLSNISDQRLRIVNPPADLSMMEHWDWVQLQARGCWQMFLGQDDALQGGYIHVMEDLTEIASQNDLRCISSARAYLNWPGSAFATGDVGNFERILREKVEVRNFVKDCKKSLRGDFPYFHLPQMYTTSMFEKSLLDNLRRLQGGRLLTCHPQDANLVAVACSQETQYLQSYIPFGWVGSSKKSAGLAISRSSTQLGTLSADELMLAETYKKSIGQSDYVYPNWAGNFSLAEPRVYLWQALLQTSPLQPKQFLDFLNSTRFLTWFFARLSLAFSGSGHRESKLHELDVIISESRVSARLVRLTRPAAWLIDSARELLFRISNRLRRLQGSRKNIAQDYLRETGLLADCENSNLPLNIIPSLPQFEGEPLGDSCRNHPTEK